MKLTQEEIRLTELVAEKCKQYHFFVSPDKKIFLERDNPKEVPKNHIVCMLRKDLKDCTTLPNKRLNKLLESCVEALLIMCERQIKEKLLTLPRESPIP